MNELKPCPFCGSHGEPFLIVAAMKGRYWVMCQMDDCGAEAGWSDTEAEAVEYWNRRAPADGERGS